MEEKRMGKKESEGSVHECVSVYLCIMCIGVCVCVCVYV